MNWQSKIVTFTTDFGEKDGFVAMMKGVILSYSKDLIFVDISNSITPFNVEEAEFILRVSFFWFPKGTIHLGVVDPGVGGKRKGRFIYYNGHVFIGPDNGIFSFALESGAEIYRIREEIFKNISPTFHGRDVFARTAGILISKGIDEVGEKIDKAVVLKKRYPIKEENRVKGKIIHIDRFGNLVTNISPSFAKKGYMLFKNKKIEFRRCYEEGNKEPFFVINGYGYYEISLRNQSAEKYFNAKIGEEVILMEVN